MGLKKSYAQIVALLAAGMAFEPTGNLHGSTLDYGVDIEKLRKYRQKNHIENLKKQGLKEFWYGEVCIYARNQKNADRKAKNQGLI